MFTKEAIKLAKPLVEAIKTITGRRERKCVQCQGDGVVYSTPLSGESKCFVCNGTGKVKGKWEWKPEYRDACVLASYRDIFTVLQCSSRYDQVKIISFEDIATWEKRDSLIPLLHWERILRILRSLGYDVFVETQSHNCRATISRDDMEVVRKIGEDSQSAMMQAVIELVKEK